MKKILGYVVALVGVLIFALSLKQVQSFYLIKQYLPFVAQTSNFIFIGVGVALIAVGILLLRTFGGGMKSSQAKEVPIYQGSKVVGFRRV